MTNRLIKIPLEKLMDLKVDYAFKQLFGNEKNKDITIVFLNAMLKRTGPDSIIDVIFSDKEIGGEYEEDKESRLDILVETNAGEKINVEIQLLNQFDMVKRSMYYWARVYSQSLQKGQGYRNLPRVITINIINFNLFKQTELFHTTYHLYEDTEKTLLTDVMELHLIEFPKLLRDWKEGKLDPRRDILVRWLLLLGVVDGRNKKVYADIYMQLEGIAMSDERLLQAFASWQNLSLSQEELNAYEGRLRRIQDEEAARAEAAQDIEEAHKQVEEAQREAKEEIQKRIEAEQKIEEAQQQINQIKQVAIQSMLAQNLTLEEIARKLELSILEVQEIIKQSK